jgi:hypothetical protein
MALDFFDGGRQGAGFSFVLNFASSHGFGNGTRDIGVNFTEKICQEVVVCFCFDGLLEQLDGINAK